MGKTVTDVIGANTDRGLQRVRVIGGSREENKTGKWLNSFTVKVKYWEGGRLTESVFQVKRFRASFFQMFHYHFEAQVVIRDIRQRTRLNHILRRYEAEMREALAFHWMKYWSA